MEADADGLPLRFQRFERNFSRGWSKGDLVRFPQWLFWLYAFAFSRDQEGRDQVILAWSDELRLAIGRAGSIEN